MDSESILMCLLELFPALTAMEVLIIIPKPGRLLILNLVVQLSTRI